MEPMPLRASEQMFDPLRELGELFPVLSEGLIRIDAAQRVVDLNSAAEDLTGWSRREARGQHLDKVYRVVGLGSREPLPAPAGEALESGTMRASPEERTLLRADGGELIVRDRAVPIRLPDGSVEGAWLIVEDVTELRALQREQRWLDTHDSVTGLPNRRAFESQLEAFGAAARDQGVEHAFGYVDLDDFEVFNDTFGAVAGDELLKQLATLLRAKLGEENIVARVSTDRLGVLIAGCPPDEVQPWAERLRRMIARYRFRWQQETYEVTASIAMVPITQQSGELMQLLGAADAASDRARDDGLEIYQFNSESSGDIYLAEHFGEMRWLSRIHRALKRGRFRLFRQPIVALGSDRATTPVPIYEVLIRMLDEQDEFVPPGHFIPAAERFHLISTLDRWVVRTVLEQLSRPNNRCGGAAIAVNLSGQSLSESRFLDFVLNQLKVTGVDPARLSFEITETATVGNLERAQRFMRALKELGCHFILDDFGSGLSSFAYLKDLEVDFLKVDREFVSKLVDDPVQAAIINSIRQVGQVMGLKIVAEGVEDEATLEALREMGIDYAQGYHIQRPRLWWLDEAPAEAERG